MHLVSYRGPGVSGGVSTGLLGVWSNNGNTGDYWWYLEQGVIKRRTFGGDVSIPMNAIDQRIIDGHYRYCNEFLWPIMHDMPQFAHYYPADRDCYNRFNTAMAQTLAGTVTADNFSFVQDYQLALLPLFLKLEAGQRSCFFWHIPWPRQVLHHHVEPLMAIARALLCVDQVGFHTNEYASNFMSFVQTHLPNYEVNEEHNFIMSRPPSGATITAFELQRADRNVGDNYITRPIKRMRNQPIRTGTIVKVCPLTIDAEAWTTMASINDATAITNAAGVRTPFILSVDRADYTKGVKERFNGINEFFRTHPGRRGKVSFLQICGRTRPGLSEFDKYWEDCQSQAAEINARWRTAEWSPIAWLEQPLCSRELSSLYRAAQGMLITAVRDGLNLTAKEYVACQHGRNSGVLLLSTGAGVWHEFNNAAVGIDVSNSSAISDAIMRSLIMDSYERKLRMDSMKCRLDVHTLSDWWHMMTRAGSSPVFAGSTSEPSQRRAAAG